MCIGFTLVTNIKKEVDMARYKITIDADLDIRALLKFLSDTPSGGGTTKVKHLYNYEHELIEEDDV